MLSLFTGSGVGPTIMYLAFAIFAGLLLGKIKIANISLGITWVLFVGILISALGIDLNHEMLHVVKEFGLILFVSAVGLQVGPTFFSSFKSGGLLLNLLSVANIGLGVLTVVLISRFSGENLVNMAGVYTGAITNTPGMSAAQQTVTELGLGTSETIANGYAVAYPIGVLGLIIVSLLLRPLCRIDLAKEPTTMASSATDNKDKAADNAPKKKVTAKSLTNLIPLFIIIFLGIILGSIPVPVGMAAPVKLGLAGGPLVVAILVGWLGVKKNWISVEYTSSNALMMIREVGIALFLAGVGLSAGGSFVSTLQGGGYVWILYGAIITIVPILITGLVARLVFHVNYYTLMGMIGGGTTDPPMLAFANTVAAGQPTADGKANQLPNTGYATVYPLTMFLRIFTAQLLVLLAV